MFKKMLSLGLSLFMVLEICIPGMALDIERVGAEGSRVSVPKNKFASLSVSDITDDETVHWEISVGNMYIKMGGYEGTECSISYGQASSALNYFDSTKVRCVNSDGEVLRTFKVKFTEPVEEATLDLATVDTLNQQFDPMETKIIDIAPPEELIPTESVPEESVPTESEPEESVPTESEPEESVPTESEPEESAPTESVPEESAPTDSEPEESVPTESVPEESVPTESVPEESAPTESAPEESVPTESAPEESIPADSISEEAEVCPSEEASNSESAETRVLGAVEIPENNGAEKEPKANVPDYGTYKSVRLYIIYSKMIPTTPGGTAYEKDTSLEPYAEERLIDETTGFASFKVIFPKVNGFLPYVDVKDENIAPDPTTSETSIERQINSDTVIHVNYYPYETEYRVKYEFENIDSELTGIDKKTEYRTFTGKSFSLVDYDFVKKAVSDPGQKDMYIDTTGFTPLYGVQPQIVPGEKQDDRTTASIYYDRNAYSIIFDLGEGGYGVESLYEKHGKNITGTTTKKPTRTGYKFMGWSETKGGEPVTLPNEMPILEDAKGKSYVKTYYAIWEPKTEIDVKVVLMGQDADPNPDGTYSYEQIGFENVAFPVDGDITFINKDKKDLLHEHTEACFDKTQLGNACQQTEADKHPASPADNQIQYHYDSNGKLIGMCKYSGGWKEIKKTCLKDSYEYATTDLNQEYKQLWEETPENKPIWNTNLWLLREATALNPGVTDTNGVHPKKDGSTTIILKLDRKKSKITFVSGGISEGDKTYLDQIVAPWGARIGDKFNAISNANGVNNWYETATVLYSEIETMPATSKKLARGIDLSKASIAHIFKEDDTGKYPETGKAVDLNVAGRVWERLSEWQLMEFKGYELDRVAAYEYKFGNSSSDYIDSGPPVEMSAEIYKTANKENYILHLAKFYYKRVTRKVNFYDGVSDKPIVFDAETEKRLSKKYNETLADLSNIPFPEEKYPDSFPVGAYEFAGWVDKSGNPFDFANTKMTDIDASVYASWKVSEKKFRIYDSEEAYINDANKENYSDTIKHEGAVDYIFKYGDLVTSNAELNTFFMNYTHNHKPVIKGVDEKNITWDNWYYVNKAGEVKLFSPSTNQIYDNISVFPRWKIASKVEARVDYVLKDIINGETVFKQVGKPLIGKLDIGYAKTIYPLIEEGLLPEFRNENIYPVSNYQKVVVKQDTASMAGDLEFNADGVVKKGLNHYIFYYLRMPESNKLSRIRVHMKDLITKEDMPENVLPKLVTNPPAGGKFVDDATGRYLEFTTRDKHINLTAPKLTYEDAGGIKQTYAVNPPALKHIVAGEEKKNGEYFYNPYNDITFYYYKDEERTFVTINYMLEKLDVASDAAPDVKYEKSLEHTKIQQYAINTDFCLEGFTPNTTVNPTMLKLANIEGFKLNTEIAGTKFEGNTGTNGLELTVYMDREEYPFIIYHKPIRQAPASDEKEYLAVVTSLDANGRQNTEGTGVITKLKYGTKKKFTPLQFPDFYDASGGASEYTMTIGVEDDIKNPKKNVYTFEYEPIDPSFHLCLTAPSNAKSRVLFHIYGAVEKDVRANFYMTVEPGQSQWIHRLPVGDYIITMEKWNWRHGENAIKLKTSYGDWYMPVYVSFLSEGQSEPKKLGAGDQVPCQDPEDVVKIPSNYKVMSYAKNSMAYDESWLTAEADRKWEFPEVMPIK